MRLLAEAKNGQQSFVDAPLLFRTDATYKVSSPARVDCANLLDKDTGDLTQQVDLGTEGRRPCAVRRRSYEHCRAGQQLVRLDDHAVSAA